jgi:hypothetical protein
MPDPAPRSRTSTPRPKNCSASSRTPTRPTSIAPSRRPGRAFDDSSWATDLEFRKECLVELQAALVGERELLRAELIAEVGAPQALTHGPQLDPPLGEAIPCRPAPT